MAAIAAAIAAAAAGSRPGAQIGPSWSLGPWPAKRRTGRPRLHHTSRGTIAAALPSARATADQRSASLPPMPPPREQPLPRGEDVPGALGEPPPLRGVDALGRACEGDVHPIRRAGGAHRQVDADALPRLGPALAAPGGGVAGDTGGVEPGERRPQERGGDRAEVLTGITVLALEQ